MSDSKTFLNQSHTSVVTYTSSDSANCKVYELSNGISIFVLDQKSLRLLLHQTESPFDVMIASTSYRRMPEIEQAPGALYLIYEDTELQNKPNAFSPKLAQQVINHLAQFQHAKKIVFACDAGQSRSPALAAAYMKHLGFEDDCIWDNPYFSPNTLVYKVMMSVYGFEITDEECVQLKARSDKALRDKICGATQDQNVLASN